MYVFCETVFGSHLYGSNIPSSDNDRKGVYLPDIQDLILQRAPKTSINTSTADKHSKNDASDVDKEMFTLQGFVDKLLGGQMVCIDMLFAPEEFLIETSPEWEFIQKHKDRFLSKKIRGYMGYIRKQMNKYSSKGDRINCLKDIKALLEVSNTSRFGHVKGVVKYAEDSDYCDFVESSSREFIEICGRKFDRKSLPRDVAISNIDDILSSYGHRARKSAKDGGLDWKAIMHAYRVSTQAVELLSTGRITFPRPDADKLLKIRKGEIEYEELEKELDQLSAEIEKLYEDNDKLRDNPDRNFADKFILDTYTNHFDVAYK